MATQPSYATIAAGSSTSTAVTTPVTVDANHPYYLHPLDNPGMTLTIVVLNEQNFSQWSRSMIIALSAKLKLRFVDGSYVPPPANTPLFMHWTRCNHMVISWILNSISNDIQNSVVFLNTASVIWKDLETRYSQSNMPKLFTLRRELSYLSQGTMTVVAYYTKLKTLSDELNSLVSRPQCSCTKCTCGINMKSDLYDHSIQVSQFLMGLSDHFTAIRG